MRVIGFIGSPRWNSNTGILVKEMLKGASEAGAETKSFNLTKMSISPCDACMYCKKNNNECNKNDDMQKLYKELEEADAFILGSPLYYGEMSAQTKLFIDRLYSTYTPDIDENNKKNMAIIFSQGEDDENIFSKYYDYIKDVYGTLYNLIDVLISVGNETPGEVKNKKDNLEKAREIGKQLVKLD